VNTAVKLHSYQEVDYPLHCGFSFANCSVVPDCRQTHRHYFTNMITWIVGTGKFLWGWEWRWNYGEWVMDHHHHHLWLAPLRVCSTTSCQQPPEWSVLGQVDCVGPWQPVGVVVILFVRDGDSLFYQVTV